jgi:hypothetical protein
MNCSNASFSDWPTGKTLSHSKAQLRFRILKTAIVTHHLVSVGLLFAACDLAIKLGMCFYAITGGMIYLALRITHERNVGYQSCNDSNDSIEHEAHDLIQLLA